MILLYDFLIHGELNSPRLFFCKVDRPDSGDACIVNFSDPFNHICSVPIIDTGQYRSALPVSEITCFIGVSEFGLQFRVPHTSVSGVRDFCEREQHSGPGARNSAAVAYLERVKLIDGVRQKKIGKKIQIILAAPSPSFLKLGINDGIFRTERKPVSKLSKTRRNR